ncbi:3-hydroxy-9,10-secoandrosta-1,3,5(10)-triene-9,17-dione monooxygenase reductase subunit [Tomitella biformata]|uniref:3-hydroxy-9,10-secoandrosta-1,3,5(10)-triene-9, 17-dione monooxygenase reductase subunit n=1 Tax=Tomitella biformata TaxID=630403 RepID=UPI000466E495|nr:3-hydroxy-9,10-secoandrosta-1,3,5(10)-triene-9,17-dione monooxygenase reductase subunit [Tomitella biformata]
MTDAAPVEIDGRALRNIFGQFCTGITIISTMVDDEPVGFACQSFAALSLDPPLVLFCPMKSSRSWQAIEQTGKFSVSILSEEQQEACAVFGSRNPDKFGNVDWHKSPGGMPLLDGSLAWLDCTIENVHDGGDHLVVYGRVQAFNSMTNKTQRPLLFYRSQYTGIQPDKSVPAQWRADLEEFLFTAGDKETWL